MNKNTVCIKIILLISLVMLYLTPLHAQDEKKLSFIVGTHASNVTDVYFNFLQIAFAELGYSLTLTKVPIKRAYQTVDTGVADGMVMVPEGLEKIYKNMVLIPEPLTTIHTVAITNGRQIEIKGMDSIKQYTVGIIRGYTIAEKLTQGMNRQIVNDHDSLLTILELGRIDIAIAMKRETQRFLKEYPKYKNITLLEPPLYSIGLFPCLNKKHALLVDQITPVIKRMINEKVLEELYKPYEVQKEKKI